MAGRDLWDDVRLSSVDVALLQEARAPRSSAVVELFPSMDGDWSTTGWPSRSFRTAHARLSPAVTLRPRVTVASDSAVEQRQWGVSRSGTITAADVAVDGATLFTAVSVYAPWERTPSGGLYSDAAAHRLLSDLSALMFTPGHRLIVAGDWNILCGHGEHGDAYYADRYRTVFDRATALGLCFVGPQAPGGRQAEPWPEELPPESLNVPTYHHSRQTPATATRQLDFVFTSAAIADKVAVSALNQPEEWGGSDHCRLLIEVGLWRFLTWNLDWHSRRPEQIPRTTLLAQLKPDVVALQEVSDRSPRVAPHPRRPVPVLPRAPCRGQLALDGLRAAVAQRNAGSQPGAGRHPAQATAGPMGGGRAARTQRHHSRVLARTERLWGRQRCEDGRVLGDEHVVGRSAAPGRSRGRPEHLADPVDLNAPIAGDPFFEEHAFIGLQPRYGLIDSYRRVKGLDGTLGRAMVDQAGGASQCNGGWPVRNTRHNCAVRGR